MPHMTIGVKYRGLAELALPSRCFSTIPSFLLLISLKKLLLHYLNIANLPADKRMSLFVCLQCLRKTKLINFLPFGEGRWLPRTIPLWLSKLVVPPNFLTTLRLCLWPMLLNSTARVQNAEMAAAVHQHSWFLLLLKLIFLRAVVCCFYWKSAWNV